MKKLDCWLVTMDHDASASGQSLIGRLLIAPMLDDFLYNFPSLSRDLLLVDRAVNMVEEDIRLSLLVG